MRFFLIFSILLFLGCNKKQPKQIDYSKIEQKAKKAFKELDRE